MKNNRRSCLALCLALLLALSLAAPAAAAEGDSVEVLTQALDYGQEENWAYYDLGEDAKVDVFLICPTVDTRSYANALDLNEKLKARFLGALDMEKGIYSDTGRLFSPYYRQMSLNAYTLSEEERAQAEANAYLDVSAAFRWYLDNANNGRPLILAGFSQGSQMCLKLMEEYYYGDGEEARALRDNLVEVYAIGWSVTEEMTREYPQIVPASGETDTGTVICFDCEDGSLTETLVIPAGAKALSINPLNWKTDGTPADRSENLGAVMETGAEPIPGLCGAYLGDRGELVVTDVTAQEYPAQLSIFPEGSYHIYDYLFFFTNLKKNVADRTAAFLDELPFDDVESGSWYQDAVEYVSQEGLMTGTGDRQFSPGTDLTRAQLVTILWRMQGQPAGSGSPAFDDVDEGAWYTEAVNWAAGEKLVEGYGNGHFGTADPVTREQMVTLFWRMDGRPAAEVPDLSSYQDADTVSEWAADAIAWAVEAGVISGKGEGLLDPDGTATRAETAQILMNYTQKSAPDSGDAA